MRRRTLHAALAALLLPLPAAALACGSAPAATGDESEAGPMDAGLVVSPTDAARADGATDGALLDGLRADASDSADATRDGSARDASSRDSSGHDASADREAPDGADAGAGEGGHTDAGEAGAPHLVTSPTSIDFGTQAYGAKTGEKVVVVKNAGTAPAADVAIALAGADPKDFASKSACGASLAPGATCTVDVSAAPTALGKRAATLEVTATGATAASTALTVEGETAYGDFTSASAWEEFDASALHTGAAGFWGTGFDGKYMYFVPDDNRLHGPNASGVLVRYDTSATFAAASSWQVFVTSRLGATFRNYAGAIFDGTYLYLVPGNPRVQARFDTRKPFDDLSSWQTFDASVVDPAAKSFAGGVFDGRYVYYTPEGAVSGQGAHVLRFDTEGAFGDAASWSSFDLTALSATLDGFFGATFDGRYVYWSPSSGGAMLRLDTQADFANPASWSTFDLTSLDAAAKYFSGATFDGRYVYYPAWAGGGSFARYDTQGDFTSSSSWYTLDTSTLFPSQLLVGGVFDGRYLTLAPLEGTGTILGKAVRLDTTAPFGLPSSWQAFDTSPVTQGAVAFAGGGFDGRHVYFAPLATSSAASGKVIRFDAKQPPSMPSAYHGSFF